MARAPTTIAILFGALLSLDTVACDGLGGDTCSYVVDTSEMRGDVHAVESARSARIRAAETAASSRRASEGSVGGAVLLAASCPTRSGPCIGLRVGFGDLALSAATIDMRAPITTGPHSLDDLGATICQELYDVDEGTVHDCTTLHGTLDVAAIDSTCDRDHAPCTALEAQLHIDSPSSDTQGPAFYGDAHLHSEMHPEEGECAPKSSSGCGSIGPKPGDP